LLDDGLAGPSLVRWLPMRSAESASATSHAPLALLPLPDQTRTRLLILQPTPFCNIDCDYCYLPGRDNTAKMSLNTVRLAAQRLLDDGLAGPSLTVVWHAGEPLVMPADFYREAFAIIATVLGPVTRVTHSMQTNATLIDDAWCGFFQQHAVRVGVSVDGPAALHDLHRRTRAGKGSHALVLRGLERLRAHGIAHHAIAVVTQATLAHADGFFDFFEQQGIREVGCNFDEAEGRHEASSLAGAEEAHATFLQRLLERSLASGGHVQVRELASAYRLVAEPLPQYAWCGESWPDNPQVMPYALLSVAWNGDFSTFSPEWLGQPSADFSDFVLGNVEQGGFLACQRTENFQRLWRAVAAGTAACRRSCAWFNFCGGGAPVNKLYENADLASTETLYCRSMLQRPLETVLRRIEQEGGLPVSAPAAPGPSEMTS
jgi:uncharacterized protein